MVLGMVLVLQCEFKLIYMHILIMTFSDMVWGMVLVQYEFELVYAHFDNDIVLRTILVYTTIYHKLLESCGRMDGFLFCCVPEVWQFKITYSGKCCQTSVLVLCMIGGYNDLWSDNTKMVDPSSCASISMTHLKHS